MVDTTLRPAPPTADPKPPRRPVNVEARRENRAGWLFVAPALVLIALFLVVPAGLALYVSLLDWNGTYSPLTGRAPFVGLDNYRELLFEDGLIRHDFMISVRNTMYFVLLVVPSQTRSEEHTSELQSRENLVCR